MFKNQMFRKLLVSAIVFGAFSLPASAVERMTYLGGLVGANFVNNDSNASANTNFGVTAGAKLSPQFGMGFYGTYYGQSESASIFGLPAGTATRTYNLAGELNIFASVFHFGGDAGAGISTWEANVGSVNQSNSNTAFIYGPEAGFDIPLGSSALSLGGEAHYLFTNATDGRNNLQVLGALKVWL